MFLLEKSAVANTALKIIWSVIVFSSNCTYKPEKLYSYDTMVPYILADQILTTN